MNVWEKQPNESATSYLWFCKYRDMGRERTLERVKVECKKTEGKYNSMLNRWSAKFNWVERAEAYDLYLEKLKRKKNEEELKKMNDRHVKYALLMQNVLVQKLNSIDPEKIRPSDIPKWLEIAVRVERSATDSVRHEQAVLENEKLKAEIEKLKAEIKQRKFDSADGDEAVSVQIYMPQKEVDE